MATAQPTNASKAENFMMVCRGVTRVLEGYTTVSDELECVQETETDSCQVANAFFT